MKKLFLISFLIYLSTLSGCKDKDKNPEPELPAETHSGANTFGCRINGKVWTYKTNASVPGLLADYNGNAMYVLGQGNGGAVKIAFTSGITHLGDYKLFQTGPFECYYDTETSTYRTDSLVNGTLTMTRLDVQNAIISGRFHFRAVNKGTGDTINITDGRFDVKYHY